MLYPTNRPDALSCPPLNTAQVFYIEAISNPLLKVADVAGVAAFSRQHKLTHVIDNTFATPVLLRPAAMGYIVVHSATKFLNGEHCSLLPDL